MIGLLILARMGSNRLPQKHLIEANQKPLLYWLIKRFEYEFEKEIQNKKVCLIVATSEKPENKKFSVATENTTCKIFQGSDDNIPLRLLRCAKHFNLTHIISIDGDDMLCSTHAARVVYTQIIKDAKHNYFSISGLPLGMNLLGYSISYLEKSLLVQKDKKLETGWGRIFKTPNTWQQSLGNYDIMGDLRFTLDYKEDATFFCEIINQLKEKIIFISDEELIKFVAEKQLYKINAFLKETYWSNYNSEKQNEISMNNDSQK
jgi:spore coat polysaccharide biosynthesis protein SpsF (cytidylyltransferase family)